MYQINRPKRFLTRGLAAGAISSVAILGGPFIVSAAADTAPTSEAWTQDAPDRERFRRAQEERGTASDMSMEQLIDRMSGTWTVEVSISPKHFRKQMKSDALAAPERRMREDRPQRRGNQSGNQAGRESQDRSASRESQDEMMQLEGFATMSSMMGDTMLRERFFTDDPRLMPGKHRRMDSSTGDRERRSSGDARLAGIAWFDLDPDAGQYSAVFIGNGKDEIHHAVGRLSRDGRRIVFRDSRMLDDDRRSQGMSNGPVVLEWMDDGKFSVTMYQGSGMVGEAGANARRAGRRTPGALTDDSTRSAAGGATGGTGEQERERTQERDRTRQPGQADRDRNRGRDRDMDQMNREDIVYRAVYTKASGNEKRELDQRIEKITSSMK